MHVPILLLAVLITFVLSIYSKRLPAMLALPMMAILFAVVAEAKSWYIVKNIIEEGAVMFAPAMMATIFGGILAMFIKNQGIAEVLIRYAAELAGDRPLVLATTLMFVTAIFFTTLSGLGGVIIVGSFVLPIMMSIGIPPITAGAITLIGIAMGGSLNIGYWQFFMTMLDLDQKTVQYFMIIMAGLYAVVGLVFCLWSLRKSQLHRFYSDGIMSAPLPRARFRRLTLVTPIIPLFFVLVLKWPIIPAFLIGLMYAVITSNSEGENAIFSILIFFVNLLGVYQFLPEIYVQLTNLELPLLQTLFYSLLLLLPFWAWTAYRIWQLQKNAFKPRAYLVMLVPLTALILLYFLKIGLTATLITSFLLAAIISTRQKTAQILTKSLLQGFESVGAAVMLMIGIGMLLASVRHENITAALQPLFQAIIPSEGISFAIIFTLLAPLSLYRGPLNILGMGGSVAAIMLMTHTLRPEAIMAMLVSVGAVQIVCDPTNLHNVWIATHTKVETLELMKRTIVFMWPMTAIALMIAAIIYF